MAMAGENSNCIYPSTGWTLLILGVAATVQEWPVQAQVRSSSTDKPMDHHRGPLCKGQAKEGKQEPGILFYSQDIAPSDLLVRVGEYHVLNTNEAHAHIDRKIKKVVTHRSFDKFTYEYDIALLEMHDGPINYQPNMIPICLPDNDNSLVGEVSFTI